MSDDKFISIDDIHENDDQFRKSLVDGDAKLNASDIVCVDDRFGSIHIIKHDKDHLNVVLYTSIGMKHISECKEYLLSRDDLNVLLDFIKEK